MSEGALERKSAKSPANSAAPAGGGDASPPAPEQENADVQNAPRKRGRPRKDAPAQALQAIPRKRGRPRKHPLPDAAIAEPPRKRGRPRKHPLPVAEPAPLAIAEPIRATPPALAPPPRLPQAPAPAPAPGGSSGQSSGAAPNTGLPAIDFNALALNMARVVEEGGKALAAYMRPIEDGKTNPDMAEHVEDAVKTLGHVAEYWMADPARAIEAQTKLSTNFISLWGATMRRFAGETVPPVAEPDPGDKRFSDPEWRNNPMFDFLRQAYVIATRWANEMVDKAEDVDPATREKAGFYLRQIAGAVSPSNFIGTNPELLRTTLSENAENLVRGMKMLAEDIEAGRGALKIRQSDASKFELGRDLAMTPGKVVYRNELMELIQYAPQTPQVFARPLLIVPPWINKFYVLDLNPEKSFVRFCVENGLTVFVISWVNPDARHANKSFEDYIREGVFEALDAIHEATGERKVTAIGYCVGGTLLSIALALMAAKGDDRIDSATLFTTQVDFTDAGDLKLFVDSARIGSLEEKMRQTGYLEGAKMASAFNMLRPNELIWGYFVNNYLKGKEPMPFDLLTWNSDSTRMPAANHSFYLRNCYLDNTLARGEMTMAGHRLNLKDVKIPIYDLAAREDHIAPARSVFTGAKLFGGKVRYVLAGSGHIAGVINPVRKPKYQYWIGGDPDGAFDDWLAGATENPGTWWTDWLKWIETQAPAQVPAREPGGGKLKPLCDAPGEYVRVKS
ncbi:MAG: class I poly(R)-hydroxyalkanoic acid synthase [Beijerinckiaceae bacterium]|nr:class I poly(R)-hydroxyalkanoic acid synthase [Beijerinckiaceae bacterium]